MNYTPTKFSLDIKNYEGISKCRFNKGSNFIINVVELKNYLKNKYDLFNDELFIDE